MHEFLFPIESISFEICQHRGQSCQKGTRLRSSVPLRSCSLETLGLSRFYEPHRITSFWNPLRLLPYAIRNFFGLSRSLKRSRHGSSFSSQDRELLKSHTTDALFMNISGLMSWCMTLMSCGTSNFSLQCIKI